MKALLPIILVTGCLANYIIGMVDNVNVLPLLQLSSTNSTSPPIPSIPDSKCTKEEFYISNNAQIEAISDCKTLNGNIVVSSYKDSILEFDNLEHLNGSLHVVNSPNLVRLEAPSLKVIDGKFTLKQLTSLVLVSFPSINSINSIEWGVLPILSTVHFSKKIEGLDNVEVSDTSLSNMFGFTTKSLQKLDINNNRFLETIDSDVESVKGLVHIAGNSDSIVVKLNSLTEAKNISILDVSSLSLKSLEKVEMSLSFIHNTFKQLKLPSLSSVGGSLSLASNKELKSVDFPTIDDIGGGLVIVNNTHVDKINFLPNLATIGGAMEIIGDIKDISLNQLKLVRGSAKIKAFAPQFDCSRWTKSAVGSIIYGGRIECVNFKSESIVREASNGSSSGEDAVDYHIETNPSVKWESKASNSVIFRSIQIILMLLISYSSLV